MKTLLLLLCYLITLPAWSGNEKGNGGDAIVCRNQAGKIITAELLDIYEGRVYRRIPHVYDQDVSNAEYFKTLAGKLNYYDTRKYKEFESNSLKFLTAVEDFLESREQSQIGYIFTDSPLIDIPDSNHLSLPPHCQVEQLAVRLKRQYEEDPYFQIQGEILKYLSEDSLRGLIIHELLYQIFSNNEDSTKIRYANQILTSKSIHELDFLTYITAMKPQDRFLIEHLDQVLAMDSFKLLSEGDLFFRTYSFDTAFIFKADGTLNLERTNQEGWSSRFEMEVSEHPLKCSPRAEYSVTDSKGKRIIFYNARSGKLIIDRETMSYGKFLLEVRVQAKEKNCPVKTLVVSFGRNTLLQTDNAKAAVVTKNLNFSIGEDLKIRVD